MGKGKGRQSGGFGYKSQRAAYSQEIQEQIAKSRIRERQRQAQQQLRHAERPRLRLGSSLGQLRSLVRERQTHDSYLFVQRRRRAGFVPKPDVGTNSIEIVSHPPGWILNYGKEVKQQEQNQQSPSSPVSVVSEDSLQGKCLSVLASCILEYLEAMGAENLHGVLALLPSDTLAELSVAISSTDNVGVNNSLAMVLGKHPHVEALSFRAATHSEDSLTDDGILLLVPQLVENPPEEIPDSWEDSIEEARNSVSKFMEYDILQLDGCNLRLKRLELIDCQSLSADALITLFQRCSCITHLSLAGSLPSIQDGSKVFSCLPELLPALQVLDVTRCAWISTSALDSFNRSYHDQNKEPPSVHFEGCFRNTYNGTKLDW